MRAKIFISVLIFLFLVSCKDEDVNPYSPGPPPTEPVTIGIKSFTFKVSVDFSDISIPFTNPSYPYWALDVRLHRDDWTLNYYGTVSIQGDGQIDKELLFSQSMGVWQVQTNTTHKIGSRYHSSAGLPGNVPPEWQEKIRWRFQIVNIELDDSQAIVKIFSGENETTDTGWFDGWKAYVPTTEGSKIKTLFTFIIQK